MALGLGSCLRLAVVAATVASAGMPLEARERQQGLPENLEVHPALRPFVSLMWEASATFRWQCRRLASSRSVQVRLRIDGDSGHRGAFRARSTVESPGGAPASADVFVRPSAEAPELIAHEMEHVLELLDGADLEQQTESGAAWRSGDGSFESRRAIEMGRRVAAEVANRGRTDRSMDPLGGAGFVTAVRLADRHALPSSPPPAHVSGNGRFLAFASAAALAPDDRNAHPDIYVLDLETGTVTLDSVGTAGAPADGWSARPSISADGRFLAFEAVAGNLVAPPSEPGIPQVFVRDRHAAVTWLVTRNANGHPGNGPSRNAALSADGSVVAFESLATDLLPGGHTPGSGGGIFAYRLTSGEVTRVDVRSSSGPGQSMSPAASGDGRFVAFASRAPLVVSASNCPDTPAATREGSAVYVRDLQAGRTTRISGACGGDETPGPSYQPSISADGRYVAFVSEAANRGRRRPVAQVYVHDRATGATRVIGRRDGRPADGPSRFPSISGNGAVVAFQSLASNLVCARRCADRERDINLAWDVFVFDLTSGTMRRASRDGTGIEWMAPSRGPSIDHAGAVLAFASLQPVRDDDETEGEHLYVWDLSQEF